MGIATTRRLVCTTYIDEPGNQHEHALEIDRTDHDEIAIHIRGFGGSDDDGSLYLTDEGAKALRVALEQALLEERPEAS